MTRCQYTFIQPHAFPHILTSRGGRTNPNLTMLCVVNGHCQLDNFASDPDISTGSLVLHHTYIVHANSKRNIWTRDSDRGNGIPVARLSRSFMEP